MKLVGNTVIIFRTIWWTPKRTLYILSHDNFQAEKCVLDRKYFTYLHKINNIVFIILSASN